MTVVICLFRLGKPLMFDSKIFAKSHKLRNSSTNPKAQDCVHFPFLLKMLPARYLPSFRKINAEMTSGLRRRSPFFSTEESADLERRRRKKKIPLTLFAVLALKDRMCGEFKGTLLSLSPLSASLSRSSEAPCKYTRRKSF